MAADGMPHLHSVNLTTDNCDSRKQLGHELIATGVICVMVRGKYHFYPDVQTIGGLNHCVGVRRVNGRRFP